MKLELKSNTNEQGEVVYFIVKDGLYQFDSATAIREKAEANFEAIKKFEQGLKYVKEETLKSETI